MTHATLAEKPINPRLAIELAILEYEPNISDKDLLDKRERIMLEAYKTTPSSGNASMYVRDYYLYSRKKMV
jgi:hypothetical protein